MAKLWKCQVTQDEELYKFSSARVSGRPFVRSEPVYLNEAQITDEIKNSPILDVEEVDDPDRPPEPANVDIDATDDARLLAEQVGVDLAYIEGTGAKGRILVKDVRSYMEWANIIEDEARLLAEQVGINLADVEGTGASGRILVKDVRSYMESAIKKDFESLAGEDQEEVAEEEAAEEEATSDDKDT